MDLQRRPLPDRAPRPDAHRHRAAVGLSSSSTRPSLWGRGWVTGVPGGLQCPHRLKQFIPEQRIAGDGKKFLGEAVTAAGLSR